MSIRQTHKLQQVQNTLGWDPFCISGHSVIVDDLNPLRYERRISKMNEPLLTSSLQSLILSKGDLSRKPDFHWTCQSEAKGSKPCNAKHLQNTWVKLSNKIFQSILPRGFSDWHMIDHKSFKSLWKHTVKVAAPSNQKQPLRGGIICHVIAHYL